MVNRKNSVELVVRKSRVGDLDALEEVYASGRRCMAATGNPTQWGESYPSRELLSLDIERRSHYVVERNGEIVGAFACIGGEEPTYAEIQGGWLRKGDYVTIHRLCSSGTTTGIADACLDFCRRINGNIRIDTHRENRVMRQWITSRGFMYCGIIRVADGSERLAYQIVETVTL